MGARCVLFALLPFTHHVPQLAMRAHRSRNGVTTNHTPMTQLEVRVGLVTVQRCKVCVLLLTLFYPSNF